LDAVSLTAVAVADWCRRVFALVEIPVGESD
jgi:hypothetical protein